MSHCRIRILSWATMLPSRCHQSANKCKRRRAKCREQESQIDQLKERLAALSKENEVNKRRVDYYQDMYNLCFNGNIQLRDQLQRLGEEPDEVYARDSADGVYYVVVRDGKEVPAGTTHPATDIFKNMRREPDVSQRDCK